MMHAYLSPDRLSALTDIGRQLLDGVLFSDIYAKELMDSTECLLFWKSVNSDYLACNKKVASIGGLKNPKLIVGKFDYDMPWRNVFHAYRKSDHEVINFSKPIINIEESIYTSDGVEKIILTSKFPIFSEYRNKKGVMGIATDITEQKTFERMLLEIQQNNQINSNIPNDYICEKLVDVRYRFSNVSECLKTKKGHYIFSHNGRMIKLSIRQVQCIVELLHGKTNKQIGKALNLSPRTIDDYLTILRRKFACVNKNALIEIILTGSGFIDAGV